jgi:superfamily I DNA/RNA helicase
MAKSWNIEVRGEQVLPLINADAQTVRVEAGPGTGKTFGLVRRVERILHPEGLATKGRDVLVVAFNHVIAKQLSQEINARLKTFTHDGEPAIRTIHALCVEVVDEELRLLLPHEREAMIYDLLQMFPPLRQKYKRASKAEQALRDHEARHVDHVELWQAARRWLERHEAHLIGDLPGLLLDRLLGGDFSDRSYQFVLVDEFQDLTPGEQELKYPGTDEEYVEEQRRLFYVSITRSKKTLVISRAASAETAEALKMGLAVEPGHGYRVELQMSRFLRDIIAELPQAVDGKKWSGC